MIVGPFEVNTKQMVIGAFGDDFWSYTRRGCSVSARGVSSHRNATKSQQQLSAIDIVLWRSMALLYGFSQAILKYSPSARELRFTDLHFAVKTSQ
jgi:hypothetical protein